MNPELIAQINKLLHTAPEEVRELVLSGQIDSSVIVLTEKYHLTVSESVAVKNIILLTLLGIIPVKEVQHNLERELTLTLEGIDKLLRDIDAGIFEKARMTLFGEDIEQGQEMRKLTLGVEENKDMLREQILSHTERDSAIKKSPLTNLEVKDSSPVLPGSRSDLLEEMSILDAIPKTDEIEERLAKIQSQFQTKEEEETASLLTPPSTPNPTPQKTRVFFPDHYTVDPYREVEE